MMGITAVLGWLSAIGMTLEHVQQEAARNLRHVYGVAIRAGLATPRCSCCGSTSFMQVGERECITCRNPYPVMQRPTRRKLQRAA